MFFFNHLLNKTNLHTIIQNSTPTINIIHKTINIITIIYIITKITIKKIYHNLIKNSFKSTLKSNK